MNILTKARIIWQFIRWRLTWDRRNTHYRYTVPDNPKFMGPRDAVALIPDGSVLGFSGLAGNIRPSIMYWAIREVFEETGHPRDLTAITLGGIGGRGRVPGTLEELGQPGLCTRIFTGHTETFKSFLRLAADGRMEVQCIPQGILALMLAAQEHGEHSLITETGIGTFVDPRVGRGTPVYPETAPQYVSVMDDGKLRFRCPKINVAIFNAPAADRRGNIYVKNAVMVAENHEMAKAAKKNGGVVIANVGAVVEEGYDKVFLPAEDVDAVVYYPDTEQTGSVPYRKHWPMFTLNSNMSIDEGIARVRFINRLVGVTPKRTRADEALARLGASIFTKNIRRGGRDDSGVGLPEEVSRLLYESGAMKHLSMMTESGVFGGLSAPGIFFGASVNPTEIVSSAEAFRRMYQHLDAAILGVLQVDSAGNVNVSKRGEGPIHYVGPGGFIDITTCASMVLFCSSWGDGAEFQMADGRVKVIKRGKPKFIDKVDEITFSGVEAMKRGKRVFYVTHVGAFQLTPRGMELIQGMPGIDARKDIIEATSMKVVLPENGQVPVVEPSIVTGKGFKLEIPA